MVGKAPFAVFVDSDDMVYVADRSSNQIRIWEKLGELSSRMISGNLVFPSSLFVTRAGEIYVDNGQNFSRVDRWTNSSSVQVMDVRSGCFGLFIDLNNFLYCTLRDHHQVVKKWLSSGVNISMVVAGNGTQGSESNMLDEPRGIFVAINLSLYVADAGNHRIQLFDVGSSRGITVLGEETLSYPTGIILDVDANLFVVDSGHHRILRSGAHGIDCLVGCRYGPGSASDQLRTPRTLAFDSRGHMYVTDMDNDRVQKFVLSTNSCSE